MLDIVRLIEVLSRLAQQLQYDQDSPLYDLVNEKLTLALNAIKEV